MTEQTGFAVTALWIYPTKDEPGVSLPAVELEAEGLAGDRRKKAALHLVCAVEAAEQEPRQPDPRRHGRSAQRPHGSADGAGRRRDQDHRQAF